MKKTFIILLLQVIVVQLFSQGEIDEKKSIFYQNEKSISFILSSNGLGANYRYGIHKGGFSKFLIDCDFSWIRHPKEIKTASYYESQKNYVFGKLNSLYSLRAGFGKQKEIFSKYDKGGIAIKYYYLAGLTLGIVKPKYYDVIYSKEYYVERKVEDFNTFYNNVYNNHANGDIVGNASFLDGINETTFEPGLFVKVGFCFEYSTKHEIINALECGAICDFFSKKIKIMSTEQNYSIFPALFISYRLGKVYERNSNISK